MEQATDPFAPRCWAEGPLEEGEVQLSGPEIRHAEKVRRIRSGDEVTLLNGEGRIGTGVYRAGGLVEVHQVRSSPRPDPELVLFMAALKQSAWDEVLKHATELGVSRVVRVESDHAVSRVEGKADRKLARWRELLVEACKQSGNPWLPELTLASSVMEVLQGEDLPEVQWVAQLGGEVRRPGELLKSESPSQIGIWIGPEGDFSAEEYKLLHDRGAVPVGLGPLVLRAETAALALLSRLRLHA